MVRTVRFFFTVLYGNDELEQSTLAINVHTEDAATRILCLTDSFVIPVKDTKANIDLAFTDGKTYPKYFSVSVDEENCRIIVTKLTTLQTKILAYEVDD